MCVRACLQWQSTPLQYASKQGHADVATLLLQHGADINKPNAVRVVWVLLLSECSSHTDGTLMLQHGADINKPNAVRVEWVLLLSEWVLLLSDWSSSADLMAKIVHFAFQKRCKEGRRGDHALVCK